MLLQWPPRESDLPPIEGIQMHDADCDHWAIKDEPLVQVKLHKSKGYCMLAGQAIRAGVKLFFVDKADLRDCAPESERAGSQGYLDMLYGIAGKAPRSYASLPPIFIVNEGPPNCVILEHGKHFCVMVLRQLSAGEEVSSLRQLTYETDCTD